eukprot:9808752-Karenia_brevis.AAC.1
MNKRWTHRNNGTKHQQTCDYALINFKGFRFVLDCEVVKHVDLGSDHKALRLRMRVGLRSRGATKQRHEKVPRCWRPHDPAEFAQIADEKINQIDMRSRVAVDRRVKHIQDTVVQTAQSFMHQDHSDGQQVENEKIQNLIKLRQSLDEEPEAIGKHSVLRKEISHQLRREYRRAKRKSRIEQISERLAKFQNLRGLAD